MRHTTFVFTICSILLFQFSAAQAQPKWKSARTHLTTPWTAEVSPENALPEYPRPQMERSQWLNLNGEWGFLLMDKKTEEIRKRGKILVPYPVGSALSGIAQRVGPEQLMVYNHSFMMPTKWAGQRILLHFGAVGSETTVFINNKEAGKHKGGYDPFVFDITPHLNPEQPEQHITVQVSGPAGKRGRPIGKQRLHSNSATNGIWQTVWLEPVPKTYIKSYRAEPDVDKSRVLVRVVTGGENKSSAVVVARIFENGQKLSEARGKSGTPLMMHIRGKAHHWSPDAPYLYDLEISLGNKKSDDKIKGYFGLRKISAGADAKGLTRLLLNNELLFQNGVLDHGRYPDGGGTPPTEAAMLYDLKMAKEMGFNMIRRHAGTAPARWYHLCDKMGLLVWQDMPAAANRSKEEQRQFKWELKSMVDHLFSHPSIVAWTPFGDSRGQHDMDFYLKKLKQWDPSRLIIAPSGSKENDNGDLLDFRSFPAPSAPGTEGGKAKILGGYGSLGLKVRGHQSPDNSRNYRSIETPGDLLIEYEELRRQLMPLIDSAGLSAAVYTQLSDSETENDGLLTFDRKVTKIEPSLMAAAHQGYLPPKPVSDTRIFIKKRAVKLHAPKPGASITFTFDAPGTDAIWLPYNGALSLRKSSTLRCRADWPDGKKSQVRAYVFQKIKPIRADAPKDLTAGISVKIFDGEWEGLPDFKTLSATEELTADGFDFSKKKKEKDAALLFDGWLEVAETGVYTFRLISGEDARLSVADQVLIENKNLRSVQEKSGSIALKKGRHAIRFAHLYNTSGQELKIWMEGEDGKPRVMRMFH